jgi:phage baseplate assembly protein V
MFDALLRIHLAPLIERLAELETEIEDLRRRGENHNRIGTVIAVDPAAALCRVSHGELLTPWIKYFNPAAGEVSETRHPSVGEQCLLINFGAGDGSAQSVALTGIPSGAYPAVSALGELHRRTYPDGAEQSYDHAGHAHSWLNGPTTIKHDRDGIELLSNGAGLRIDAGGVHVIGPALDHNGTNVGQDHLHKDTQPKSGATSGPPA